MRHLFDEIVELPAAERQARISSLDLAHEVQTDLRLMLTFDDLMQHAPEQRAIELAALTLSESDRSRMQRMLSADAHAPALLLGAATESSRDLDEDEELGRSLLGTHIGTFRLLELIGHGGSSVVFRAERAAGDGAQVVALKLLRTGLYSADAQRRFRREQAILAQLTHPNIASLIEGGVSEAGIPYIAMELIEGVPITHAADARAMSIEQRLRLFCTLCRTIEAAHATLIVHRDLKPSNLLITNGGSLKVLDFGIARLIDDDDATRTHSIALTPEYAAPEQFRPGPLTTSVDIYALGVVLGELLTGLRLAPNSRASATIASNADGGNGATPNGLPPRAELARRLRGDLDSILAVALSEEPARRYRSANAFADDVERHLSARPVRAHPPSPWYRLRKFASRHRIAIAASALLLFGMVGALAVAVWQGIKAQHSAAAAQTQAARADSMRDFMFNAFAETEPTVVRKGPVTVVEVVERAIKSANTDRTIDPRARAELLSRLGEIIGSQGDLARSGSVLESARAQSAGALGENDPLVWDITRLQAVNQLARGEYVQARTTLDALLVHVPSMSSALKSKLLFDSASVARRVRDFERARSDARSAVAVARSANQPDVLLDALDELGAVLLTAGEIAEAIDVKQEVLSLYRARFGEQSSQTADAMAGLSRAYLRVENYDQAEQFARAATALDKQVYPGDHWIVANHLNALGMVLLKKRNFAGALEALSESHRMFEATVGENHPDTVASLQPLAFAEVQLEDYASALPRLRRALSASSEKFGEHSYQASFLRADLGYAMAMNGDYRAGAEAIERAIGDFQKLKNPDWDEIGRVMEKRIRIALSHEDAASAMQGIDGLADAGSRVKDQALYWRGRAECLRGEVLLALRRASEAAVALSQCGEKLDSARRPDAMLYATQPLLYSAALQAMGDMAKAHEAAGVGRKRLLGLASPPSRLMKLESTLPR